MHAWHQTLGNQMEIPKPENLDKSKLKAKLTLALIIQMIRSGRASILGTYIVPNPNLTPTWLRTKTTEDWQTWVKMCHPSSKMNWTWYKSLSTGLETCPWVTTRADVWRSLKKSTHTRPGRAEHYILIWPGHCLWWPMNTSKSHYVIIMPIITFLLI